MQDILKCPVCLQDMVHKKKRGVLMDVCESHGVWLDSGELETILKRQRRRLRFTYSRRERELQRYGRLRNTWPF